MAERARAVEEEPSMEPECVVPEVDPAVGEKSAASAIAQRHGVPAVEVAAAQLRELPEGAGHHQRVRVALAEQRGKLLQRGWLIVHEELRPFPREFHDAQGGIAALCGKDAAVMEDRKSGGW